MVLSVLFSPISFFPLSSLISLVTFSHEFIFTIIYKIFLLLFFIIKIHFFFFLRGGWLSSEESLCPSFSCFYSPLWKLLSFFCHFSLFMMNIYQLLVFIISPYRLLNDFQYSPSFNKVTFVFSSVFKAWLNLFIFIVFSHVYVIFSIFYFPSVPSSSSLLIFLHCYLWLWRGRPMCKMVACF